MVVESQTQTIGLSRTDIGHLNYLAGLATQPTDDWSGWFAAKGENANYARRFQIAFAGYALAGLAACTPAYRGLYGQALRGLIERMIHRDTWQYWAAHDQNIPPDPIIQGNVQYSGHLSCLIGLYEKITGDHIFDQNFKLVWDDDHALTYSHRQVAETIHRQQVANPFHGVPCEPGNVYAPCNNHAALSNILYDQAHGTNLANVNDEWVAWAKKHMFAKPPIPLPQGVVSVVYMTQLKMAAPVSFNFTDAWGLALMAPYNRKLVEEHYPKFRSQFGKGNELACLHSAGINDRMEISNTGLNTGFAYMLAREMGDTALANRLRRWADETLAPTWEGNRLYYSAGKPAIYVTALFTLGDVLNERGLYHLFAEPWLEDRWSRPYLETVSPSVAVTAAEYDPDRACLVLGLDSEPKMAMPEQIELLCANIDSITGIEGLSQDSWEHNTATRTVRIKLVGSLPQTLTLTGCQ